MDVKMAWRNIWRNPRRTILTIAAIAFACLILVFMLSFQFGSYETMINASVKIHTGHLQIQARGYQDKRRMRLVVSDPEDLRKILESMDGVEAYTFRANAFCLVSSKARTYGVMVVGIDPDAEAGVSRLKKLIREGEYLSKGDKNGAIVGRLLAKNLKVDLGDELTAVGQGLDGSIAASVFDVRGIYSSGMDEFDRSAVHITLENFRDVFAMGRAVHEVVVIGQALDKVPGIKMTLGKQIGELNPPLAVLDWQELMPGLIEGIKIDLVSGLIFYFILIMVVAFSILNTFLMAIFERTREFGVLMAIGTTPKRLTKILLFESMILTLVGISVGIIIGSLVTLYAQSQGIILPGSSELLSEFGISGKMHPKLSFLSAMAGPAAVLVVTFIAALYPALKIRKLRPVEAMSAL